MHYTKKLFMVLLSFVIIFTYEFQVSYTASLGTVNTKLLSVRKAPNTNSKVLANIKKGEKISILKSSNGWCNINFKGTKGWVKGNYISVKKQQVKSKFAIVNAQNVNIRNKAGTSGKTVGALNKGSTVEIITSSNNWYNVRSSSGTIGWIRSDFLNLVMTTQSRSGSQNIRNSNQVNKIKVKSTSNSQRNNNVNVFNNEGLRGNIIEYSKTLLNTPYVWGGNSPSQGFDCSGFVKYVFGKFGIYLGRTASGQAKQGIYVEKPNLKPGDIVLFDTNGRRNFINHSGIYIGNGNFIHASSSRSHHCVTICNLNNGFYNNSYMTGRRVID